MKRLCRSDVGAQWSRCQFGELEEMHTASCYGLVRSHCRCKGKLSSKPQVMYIIGFDLMETRIDLDSPIGQPCLFNETLFLRFE